MWFARARQRFADWRTYRETVLILKRLDPHTLADVGLTRGEIPARTRAAIAERCEG